jgi:hypothetical protein
LAASARSDLSKFSIESTVISVLPIVLSSIHDLALVLVSGGSGSAPATDVFVGFGAALEWPNCLRLA